MKLRVFSGLPLLYRKGTPSLWHLCKVVIVRKRCRRTSDTLDVYGGVSDSMGRESAQRVEAFIQSASG